MMGLMLSPGALMGACSMTVGSPLTALERAEPVFRRSTDAWWPDREWETLPAEIEGDVVRAELPDDAAVCYLNVIEERGLVVSSEHEVIADDG